jgi:GTPase SAR1 family protein
MSTWDQTRGEYIPKLKNLLTTFEQLQRLRSIEPDILDSRENSTLDSLTEGVQRQLRKLETGEFHVAIVGLEKSGKSTFLNAWLGAEILPNQPERCTYTSTEILSLHPGDGEQRIEIEFMKSEELQIMQDQYKETAKGTGYEADLAKTDLSEIQKYHSNIQKLLGRQIEVFRFSDNSEVMDILAQYVADPSQARAVKTVKVFTRDLVSERGIIFHDVPGYDSPIQMHKNQARNELRRADAVIFVTDISASVSLRDSQLQILQDVDREDPSIKISNKVFFFLNKADKADSRKDLRDRIESSRRELVDKYNVCLPERIVTGSAAVHLVQKGHHISIKTRERLGDRPYARLEALEAPNGDGVDYLRQLINHYLEEDRALILRSRCSSFINQGNALVDKALSKAQNRYPDTLDSFERDQASRAQTALANWFDDLWSRFKHELTDFWQKSIQPVENLNLPEGQNERVDKLYEEYVLSVHKLKEDGLLKPDDIKDYFAQARKSYALPERANDTAREKQITEKILPAMDELTVSISATISDIIHEVELWTVNFFFSREEIASVIVPQSDRDGYRSELRHGLNALLLRYARPAAEIFIRTKRGSADRDNMLRALTREIQILSIYYAGKKTAQKNLEIFIKTGTWHSVDKPLDSSEISGVNVTLKPTPTPKRGGLLGQEFQTRIQTTPNTPKKDMFDIGKATVASTLEEVESEILADSEAFIDYLIHSVYHAASFSEYTRQELQRIKVHLESDKTMRRVREIINYAHSQNDPRITQNIDGDIRKAEHVRRVLAVREQLTKARKQITNDPNS